MAAEPAIVVDGLRVRRGRRPVLHDLRFSVAAGSVTGLLGPSGCGKTTLMRAIVGVQVVEAGRVEVLGAPAGAPPLRPRVGYVTQAPSVYGDLSVRENLRYFARVLGVPRERVGEAIETVVLGEQADQVVASLSGGQSARVSLATALLGRPSCSFSTSPPSASTRSCAATSGGPSARLADAGTTLLVSSHVMDEAEHCDELLLMREGELLAAEAPDALRARTGEQRLDEAFLALIEQREVAQ